MLVVPETRNVLFDPEMAAETDPQSLLLAQAEQES